MFTMNSTTTLYLVLTIVSLGVVIYSQHQKKDSKDIKLAWTVFGIMLVLFILNASATSTETVEEMLEQSSTSGGLLENNVPVQNYTNSIVTPSIGLVQESAAPVEIKQQEVKQLSGIDTLFAPLVDPSKLENKSIYDVHDSNMNPEDLMPSTDNDWSKLQSLVDIGLKDQNFLTPRHTGLSTVSSANKNACYDLRGTIPVPKIGHMPWGNSSYESEDLNKQLQLNIKL